MERVKHWIGIFLLTGLASQVSSHTILEQYHCSDSAVAYNTTLKGGKAAGLFRNYGPVKNIQECVLKCCDVKNCDVAMLEGRSKMCIGVHCFNESSCESVPVSPVDHEDLQIAHVTGRGLGNVKVDKKTKTMKTDEPDKRCPHNEIMYNMKLTGGLLAGKFTDIGRVKSIMTCIRYCCDAKVECDLAFMLGNRCYLVKCYTEDRCQAIPASDSDFKFKQKMAFVAPWLYDQQKKVVKVPSGFQKHHVQCTQSKIYTGSKLLQGSDAGEFTDIGKVGKMHICARLCCEDPSCDVAYMFGKSCFLVRCYSEESCRVIPDEDLRRSNTTTFDKEIQYIIKRQFGVKLNPDGSIQKDDNHCSMDGEIHNKTVLSQGMLAGKLTHHHNVADIRHCIGKCCEAEKCHVALMFGGLCYSMECANEDACKPKTAPLQAHSKNPSIAYVKRGAKSMAPKKQQR